MNAPSNIRPASESAIQKAFASLYAQAASRHMIGHSIPNERTDGRGLTGKLIGMGMRKGAADWIVWWTEPSPVVAYIEFKSANGTHKGAQIDFESAVKVAGGTYLLARDPMSPLLWLEDLGAPLRRVWRGGGLVLRGVA